MKFPLPIKYHPSPVAHNQWQIGTGYMRLAPHWRELEEKALSIAFMAHGLTKVLHSFFFEQLLETLT